MKLIQARARNVICIAHDDNIDGMFENLFCPESLHIPAVTNTRNALYLNTYGKASIAGGRGQRNKLVMGQ